MKRIVPGLMLAGGWLLLLLNGSLPLFWLVMVVVALVGAYEYVKMAVPRRSNDIDFAILSPLLALPVILSGIWHEDGVSSGLFFGVLLSMIYVLFRYSSFDDGFLVMARLVFGTVYVGFCMSHLVLLWLLPEGNFWLVILVAVTAGSDSGAYYVGKKFGRRKLCPSVSPKKTVEGACGGIFFGGLAAILCALLLLQEINWIVLLPMAMILTGVGILGDLCESIVKRGTGTKDSGTLLLGHGGILDRIDSLLLAAPFLYYMQIIAGYV
ncbi:MAG: phosphatidate cytidylyltransferase [Desulfopila sp.]